MKDYIQLLVSVFFLNWICWECACRFLHVAELPVAWCIFSLILGWAYAAYIFYEEKNKKKFRWFKF